MSTKYKEDEFVKCPWYKKESLLEIKCSGLCTGTAIQVFKTKKELMEYKYSFCQSMWKTCEHSLALIEKEHYENEKTGRK